MLKLQGGRRSAQAIPVLRRTILLIAAALIGHSPAHGRQDDPTFSTGVKVVNVLTTVRDKKGQIIRDLTREDFQLFEDRRPQTIRYFSRQSDLPLTIGLMVDTSMSQQRVLDAERGASFRFIDQVLRETKDRVFIMQFDMSVQLRQPLTDSRKKLDDALSFVDTPTRGQLQMAAGSGGTLLYDAVVQASQESMASPRGRKALIVLSDGVDFGSENNLTAAIDAAQKADTLVYSILFSDAGAYGLMGSRNGKGALTRMSRETGGSFFEVSKKQSIDQIFAWIEDELRSQYNIGYVSDLPLSISEFRRIQLETRQKGFMVQARDKYWARP